MTSPAQKIQRLHLMSLEYRKDPAFDQLRKTASKLVMGVGHYDPKVLFVGEAPGKNEDREGVPFVGRSGEVLDDLLEGIGLARSDVFITNIVKYRPPGNRDPSEDEKKASLKYLQQEVRILMPRIVCPLGRHALNGFFPRVGIKEMHGKIIERRNRIYLPLYHPATVLYDRSSDRKQRTIMEEDFQQLAAAIKLAEEKWSRK